MAFGGPNIKCLLSQITSVGFGLGQAKSKLIERAIILLDQCCKVQTRRSAAAFINMTHQDANCSRNWLQFSLAHFAGQEGKNTRLKFRPWWEQTRGAEPLRGV